MENKIDNTLKETAESIIAKLRFGLNAKLGYDSDLSKSLKYKVNNNRLLITASNYWDYAEKGRPPGGVPFNFETILKKWMQRKGLVVDNPDKFISNVKWKTIKDGSYLYRNPQERRNFIGNVIDDEIVLLLKKIPNDVIIIV